MSNFNTSNQSTPAYLLIGDLHVKPDNLEESKLFINWVFNLCKEKQLIPIFMGDQYDTHGNIRVEILDFWQKTYERFKESYSLVGNHDMDYSCEYTSMIANAKQTRVINAPYTINSQTLGLPYFKLPSDFTEIVNNISPEVKFVLCHQDFFGAQYEGGFYAPNGVKLEDIKRDVTFISGHIHKKQTITDRNGQVKVLYVGTPRQLTRADIEEVKGVHVWSGEHVEFIPTPENVCQRFKKITLIQNEVEDFDHNVNAKTFIDIHGDDMFIKKMIKDLPELVKVRTFPAKTTRTIEIKESSGIKNAFKGFFDNYIKVNNINEEESKEMFEIIKNNCNIIL